MFCMVIDFGKKFHLFGTVSFKHEIVDDKNIDMFFEIHWKNGTVDNSRGKYYSEAYPVNLNHFHETIYGIFVKTRSIPSFKQAHVHASVQKISKNRY